VTVGAYAGRGVHGRIVELLGRRVASGELPEGAVLDLRALGAELGVSMSVLRESVRVLAAKGLLDSRQKRGTFVRPRAQWHLLDADVVRWRASGDDTARLMADLAELRSLVEPAAARYAARRRTDTQLAELADALDRMAHTRGDPRAHALADLEFHRRLLAASGNELLARMDLLVAPGLVERDVLVHSAQSFNYGPIRRLTPQEFDESWRTGPLAAVQLMQAAFPALRETQGLIVNVASGAGITAPPAMAAYAMAKEAMRTLTRVAAVEWGRYGIRALALCPFAQTDGMDDFEQSMGVSRDKDLVPAIPLGRLGDPETDIGRVVAFLASDDARYLTGSTLMVDGGYTYLR